MGKINTHIAELLLRNKFQTNKTKRGNNEN